MSAMIVSAKKEEVGSKMLREDVVVTIAADWFIANFRHSKRCHTPF
jgi:hypothetical protein